MVRKFVTHVSKRTLRAIGSIILIGILLFFGATRTQYGRDALSRKIEDAFSDSFEGDLRIGKLTGNLLNTLYATDVELLDSLGNQIVLIDSIIIEPRWQDLIQRQFSVRNITLYRPHVAILFYEDGTLNLERALRSTRISDTTTVTGEKNEDNDNSGWSFRSATIHIKDGSIRTSRNGPGPAVVTSGAVYDFTNAEFRQINVEARIDWIDPVRVLDIVQFSGLLEVEMPEFGHVILEGGQAQVLLDEQRLSINDFAFTLGGTSLAVQGWMDVSSRRGTTPWVDLPFEFELLPSIFEFDELSLIFPRIPIKGGGSLSSSITGPMSNITISTLELKADDATLEISGTVTGLPHYANFELSFRSSGLTPDRLQRWFPEAHLGESLTMESLDFNSVVSGALNLESDIIRLLVDGNAEVRSSRGTVSASFEIDGPLNDSLRFDIRLSSSGINLAYWTGNPNLSSSLNGSIRLAGTGFSSRPALATISSEFTDFRLANIFVPELSFTGQSDSLSFRGSFHATQNNGRLDAEFRGRYQDPDPEFSIELTTRGFDLGSLLSKSELSTGLNFRSTLSGTGTALDRFFGDFSIVIDSSYVVSGGKSSQIPPHKTTILFRKESLTQPRLSIRGDIMDLDLWKNIPVKMLLAIGSAWIQNTAGAVRRAGDKPLYARDTGNQPDDDLLEAFRWQTVIDLVEQDGLHFPFNLNVHATILRADILTSFFPGFPAISTSGRAEFSTQWSETSVNVDLSYIADSLRSGSLWLPSTSFSAHFEASSLPAIEQTALWSVQILSDSLVLGGQTINAPSLNASYAERHGRIRLSSSGTGPLDSLIVDARFMLLPDRARLHFDKIKVQGGNSYWISSGRSDIEWYSDALLVNDIRLSQYNEFGPTGQSLYADGRFSEVASDTLLVEATDVVLHDFSNFASLKPHFGGLLNARLAVSRDRGGAKIVGSVDVDRLSVDSWIIGDLAIRSTLTPGSPDIDISLVVQSVDSLSDATIFGTESAALVVENQLDVRGTIRLADSGGIGDENGGTLDLIVDVDRADLFFFEYIFNEIDNVSGYISGDGRIGGTLLSPVFDINLGIHDGRLDIPVSNLTYQLESDVRVDAEAIRVRSGLLTDPTGGTASISGSLLFNNYRFFTLDLSALLDEFQIMNVASSNDLPFYGFLWASGDVTVQGPLFDAAMRSSNASVTANSELFIPVVQSTTSADIAYIVFEDSLGHIPDFKKLATRSFLLATRPDAERRFLDALDMDLNIFAPEGSTLRLVIDPLLGDVINAESTGRLQLQRIAGDFFVFGTLEVDRGDYQFTAGEVFVRKFLIDPGGTITWSGDPINAVLNIPASYRTRASTDGLAGANSNSGSLIPLVVTLQITGVVNAPEVELGLAIDRSNQSTLGEYQAIEASLNAPDKASEYATSVLLTNSFMLTTDNVSGSTGSQLAFNSVSQLVSSQLNRFISEALPNVDFTFGLQGESAQDLDVTYGVALRLMDEKLVIRGQGLYQGSSSSRSGDGGVSSRYEGIQGEFVVEVKLSPTVSVEAFFRREGNVFESAGLTDTSGAGISYQTEFSSWRKVWSSMFGWISSSEDEQKSKDDESRTSATQ